MPYQEEMKAIHLLQKRSCTIEDSHKGISSDIENLKARLVILGADEIMQTDEFHQGKTTLLADMNCNKVPLTTTPLSEIYTEANYLHPNKIGLADILSIEDFHEAERRISTHVLDFNRRYNLDGWDYAIAGGCGLFAAMLDVLCVSAPPKPTAAFTQNVDGLFNRTVQNGFNKILPPDLSHMLSENFIIGAPDTSTTAGLLDAPAKALNPMNHRLRALSHDPIFGVLFGALDMMRGTCTTVVNGKIISIPTTHPPTGGNVFQLIGRMLGHLLSDVNAPSARGNRGMGLPAPFMGLLRMLEGIPVGTSDFGKQVEWMYVNGYDFRQFVVTSIPMTIMEVLMRVFYVGKQMKVHNANFGETVLDTLPLRLNPRFRIMLALAYGTSSAVNAGKMYITQNILDANYASWMGLTWNGFHALKWALVDKHLKLWNEIEEKELQNLQDTVEKLTAMEERATTLPI